MERKAKLLDLLAQAHEQEQRWAAQVPEQDRQATGSPEAWAAKDVWAHVVVWVDRLAKNLEAVAAGKEPTPPVGDVDHANAEIFAAHRDDPWETVAGLSERAYRALADQTMALDEAQLNSTELLPRSGRPLWRQIVGNGYMHPIQHWAAYYVDHGQADTATRLEEEAAAIQWDLDEEPGWRGTVRYNQACHHALAGEKDRALAFLAEALSLAPDLAEWSKQDTDLDSLRGEPEYLALVG